MLALTRKRGEAITIGTDIRIVVLQVKGGSVRLGIEAPRSVEVHRDGLRGRWIVVEEDAPDQNE